MAIGTDNAIGAVANLITTAVDKIWPNPEDKAKAECILMTAQLDVLKTQMSVMLAEASSADPFTSRARPSFLYVVYTMLLWSIPMGIISAISPDVAINITKGSLDWLKAIPENITDLFAVVMSGYVLGRTYEKTKGIK
jgi:hypothetical protein